MRLISLLFGTALQIACDRLTRDMALISEMRTAYAEPCALAEAIACLHRDAFLSSLDEAAQTALDYARISECEDITAAADATASDAWTAAQPTVPAQPA
jgi:hypothetical protein